jgi:hypothetical protein
VSPLITLEAVDRFGWNFARRVKFQVAEIPAIFSLACHWVGIFFSSVGFTYNLKLM